MTNNRKFTIMELLVVVAVIGILASLLLPSLSKAKKTSLRAVCTSNEKQIGILFQLYITNNNAYYPTTSSSALKISWDDQLSDYDGRELSQADKETWHLENTANVEVYQCPASVQVRTGNLALMSYGVNSSRVFNYPGTNPIRGITGWLGPVAGGTGWSMSANNIPTPDKSIALLESHLFSNIMGHTTAEEYINMGHFTFRYSPVNESSLHNQQIGGNAGLFIHGPKNHMMNYLYTDGHVAYRSVRDTLGSAYPNFVSGSHNQSAATGTQWNILD